MYIRRVEHTLRDISNSQQIPSYLSSYNNVSTQKNGGGNGLLNFGIALGGIFLITIITGIITYLYRKKFNCKQKESSNGSKESNDNISSIMDYYSNNYITGKDGNNNNPNNVKNDAPGSGITNDTTIKTNKSGCNIMNIIKCNIGKTSNKSSKDKTKSNRNNSNKTKSNKNRSDKTKSNKSKVKNKRSKSVPTENRSRSDTIKKSKSMKYIKRSSNERIEYIVPQISSPISMPSASIYDIERASSLANSLSRSTAFQFPTPPTPPTPARPSIIDKQPKDVERGSGSQQKFSSKLNSFYNLIPFIFMDSETETNTNIGPTVPQKTISVETTSSAGVIPNWSKAPWNDDLTFHKNNNDNNNNNNDNNSNNNSNNNNDDDDDDDDNDDSNNNDNNNHDDNSLSSSRYSEDLIRFSNGSKYSTSNSRYRIDQQVSSSLKPDSNTNDNPESSESKSKLQEYKKNSNFINELKINIEKDPEKYEFLKNPTENHHNWKRNGNFFEYRLQRSKTII